MPDLNTIPGFTALQALTLGDPRIKIAVLDGPADLDRACFRGANISRVKPFWQEELEPIDPFYIQQELKIRKLSDQKKALKKTKKALEKQQEETHSTSSTEVMNEPETLQTSTAQITAPNLDRTSTVTTILGGQLTSKDASTFVQYQQQKAATSLALLDSPKPVPTEPTPSIADLEAALATLEAEIETLQATIPEPIAERLNGIFHATGIFGTMFGQPGSPVEGVAPYCTVINIPLFETPSGDAALSPLNLAHAFNLALELGVNIIHCAACHPTQTGFAHEMIQKAVKQCQDNGILIVAPSGNNKGEWFCAPAILPNVLAVGMMKDDGQPANYSNWGGQYQQQGILAPGENIIAAQPGTDEPARQEGTSLSAPLMTGLSALLMSVQLQRGEQPNAEVVRQAWLESAIPCNPDEVTDPDRCLAGKLNIPGAYQLLTGQPLPGLPVLPTVHPQVAVPQALSVISHPGDRAPAVEASSPIHPESQGTTQLVTASASLADPSLTSPPPISPASVNPSAANNLVYALGTLGYDFGTEARRDTFKQRMPAVNVSGVLVPANPYDARQMVNYLEANPAEGKSLIWTLNHELTPIYALKPIKAFATEIYAAFQMLLNGQIQPESSQAYIERVSIPGILTDKTVELFSGQIVPLVQLPNVRGVYGWQINALVESVVAIVLPNASPAEIDRMQQSLRMFLHRVYFDLRNLGQLDRDRALNFAATNIFQAASTFAEALATGMQLETIEVEKSPFCRLDSNCWDVKLKFFDSENSRRAKKIYRFTIDVKDAFPVTLGSVRSWSVPR